MTNASGNTNVNSVATIGDPSPLPRWFWIGFAVMCLAKLVLVSQDEILTYGADDTGWAYVAGGWYWGNPYGAYAYVRQPVYPLFIAISNALGVPARLAIELLWFGCAAIGCVALRRCGVASAVTLVAAFAFVFHPWALRMNNRLLVDTFYAPVFAVFVLAATAALISGTRRSMLRWGLIAGAGAALAANTRQESILITGSIALAAAIGLGMWRLRLLDRRRAMTAVACAAAVPLVMTMALTHAFKLANKVAIGSYVTFDFDMPGYKALYRAILAIPPEHPSLILTAPADVRERAFAASPTLARLKPKFESNANVLTYATVCEQQTGVKGEFGAWFCWALRQAAWEVAMEEGWKTAGELDVFYARAAAELEAATNEKRLAHRWVPVDFVPPEWELLRRAIPDSMAAVAEQFPKSLDGRALSIKMGDHENNLFDAVAGRRAVLAKLASGGTVQDSLWQGGPAVNAMEDIKGRIHRAWPEAVWFTFGSIAVGTIAGLAVIRRGWLQPRWYVLCLMLWGAIVARVMMVAVVDASGVPVQPRYLLAASVCAVVLSLAGTQATARVGWMALHRARTSRRDQRPALAPPIAIRNPALVPSPTDHKLASTNAETVLARE